jgi:hypothetical protein
MDRQIPVGYPAALLASFLFGWAITPSRGAYSDPAMTMVVLGSIVVTWRYVVDFKGRLDLVPARIVAPLAWGVVLAMAFTSYNDAEIIIYPVKFWDSGRRAQSWLMIALLAYLPSMLKWQEPRWARHLRFVFVAVCIGVAGVDTYVTSPRPNIDVFTVQQTGAAALLEGKNPFQEVHVGDTGPRSASDVPYVYPPMQLYVTVLAMKLKSDTRYAILVAALLLGFALRAISKRFGADKLPAILEDAPALFVWCTPKFFFILEQAWVDPVQIMWVSALVLAAALNRPWLTAVLAGLVVGAKQTMLIVAGLYGFGLRFTIKQWALAGGVALATFLPWMIWDFNAWKHANFDFLSALPVRQDALTYITWVRRKFAIEIPYVIAFPASAALIALAAWKGPRTIGRITMAVVASMMVFFVFNKWAFANYYFTLMGLSALAAAAALDRLDEKPPETATPTS